MPVKLSQERQAWVKTAAPPKKPAPPKYTSLAEQKEAICARLRYFACQPMDGRDRIRMLNRPFSNDDGMVDVDRAPSPVPDQWTGAGLKFQNGMRGGGGSVDRQRWKRFKERGFDMESNDSSSEGRGHRVISEPARVSRPSARSRSRARTVIEDDLVEVIEEPSLVDEDIRTVRSYRSRRSRYDNNDGHHAGHHDDMAIPNARRTQQDSRSQRSASPQPAYPAAPPSVSYSARHRHPPPPPSQAHSIHSRRQREPIPTSFPTTTTTQSSPPRPQARNVTAPAVSSVSSSSSSSSSPWPRPTPAPVPASAPAPLSSTYQHQFQSAIFKNKESANHYKSVYEKRNRDGSVGPASWASATSALSFD